MSCRYPTHSLQHPQPGASCTSTRTASSSPGAGAARGGSDWAEPHALTIPIRNNSIARRVVVRVLTPTTERSVSTGSSRSQTFDHPHASCIAMVRPAPSYIANRRSLEARPPPATPNNNRRPKQPPISAPMGGDIATGSLSGARFPRRADSLDLGLALHPSQEDNVTRVVNNTVLATR